MPAGQALLDQMARTPIIPGSLAIWGLGQMGVAIKGPEGIIYFDPYLSDSVREQFGEWWHRAYPTPLEAGAVNNATACLISHEHLDHLDPSTLTPLAAASPNATFVVNGWCIKLMMECGVAPERILAPPALEAFTLAGTSARVTAVPAAHYEREYDAQKGYRWVGYLVEWNGVTFFHGGDTIIYPSYVETLRDLPKADVAMMPVNGRDWYRETTVGAIGNLLPAELAGLANELGWDVVIAGHNDMFPNNTIPMGEVVNALATIAPRQKHKILQPGELYYYVK